MVTLTAGLFPGARLPTTSTASATREVFPSTNAFDNWIANVPLLAGVVVASAGPVGFPLASAWKSLTNVPAALVAPTVPMKLGVCTLVILSPTIPESKVGSRDRVGAWVGPWVLIVNVTGELSR